MNQTVFEAHGEELIARAGMTKAEFARRMGIKRQNVKALFHSPKLETIQRASSVLNIPFVYLVGYVNPIDYDDEPFTSMIQDQENQCEEGLHESGQFVIRPEDIPTGDTTQDRRERQRLIRGFYKHWIETHPEACEYNYSLKGMVHVAYVSVHETSGQASLTYLSTLAVLQLDAILQNAVYVAETEVKKNNKSQKIFEKMLLMKYRVPGIGDIKLTVGVKKENGEKIQYCITAIEAVNVK